MPCQRGLIAPALDGATAVTGRVRDVHLRSQVIDDELEGGGEGHGVGSCAGRQSRYARKNSAATCGTMALP
jgi:hypothetical protein